MNINQQKQSPNDSQQQEKRESSTEPKEGINPPDAEDASAEDEKENSYGNRSYAAPDSDEED